MTTPRTDLTLWSQSRQEPITVKGVKVGAFGVHRARLVNGWDAYVEGKAYSVSHLPSGHHLESFRTKKKAMEFARSLKSDSWLNEGWVFGDVSPIKRFNEKTLEPYESETFHELDWARHTFAADIVAADWGMR